MLDTDSRKNSRHGSTLEMLDSVPTTKRRSSYAAAFLMLNGMIGMSLLNFPRAFSQCGGIFTAVSYLLVIVLFVSGSLYMLSVCAEMTNSTTLQEIVYSVLGKCGEQICCLVIVLYLYGNCISYIVAIGDQCDIVIASAFGNTFCHQWYFSRPFVLPLVTTIMLLPLCFSKDIDFLKYPSYFGMISIVYLVALVTVKYFSTKEHSGSITAEPRTWSDSFLVIPTICVSFQCQITGSSVYAGLKNRSPNTFRYIIAGVVVIASIAYLLTGIFGYLTFGAKVSGDLLLQYDANDISTLIGVFMLAIKLMMSYPIALFCGRTAFQDITLVTKCFQHCSMPSSKCVLVKSNRARRITISLLWFLTSLTVAIFIPGIGLAVRILGSLAALIIFNFPGCCLSVLSFKRATSFPYEGRVHFIVSVLYQIIGILIVLVTIIQNITVPEMDSASSHLCSSETINNFSSNTQSF